MRRPYLRVIGLGTLLLSAWAVFENTFLLRVKRYRLHAPTDLPRMVLLSDLHKRRFGKNNRRLIEKTAAQAPELIVITGDLVSRTVRDFSAMGELLSALNEIAPVVMIPGNHEADLPEAAYQAYRQTAYCSGAVLLENQTVHIGRYAFSGLMLPREYYRGGGFLGFSGEKGCTVQTVQEQLGACAGETVLLAHNPIFFPAYASWGAALTLSGHVHGGAVRLPLLGGLLSPERMFFPRYDKGLFRIKTHALIVSGGLGKLRLFNPPEIVVIGN